MADIESSRRPGGGNADESEALSRASSLSLPAPSSDPVLFALDIETTGFFKFSRIIQVGVVEGVCSGAGLSPGESFSSLIHPGAGWGSVVQKDAERVHGISAAMLVDARPMSTVLRSLVAFVAGRVAARGLPPTAVVYILAHNGHKFDAVRVMSAFSAFGLEWPPSWHWVDSLPMVKKLYPDLPRKTLGSLAEHFEVGLEARLHRADADADVLLAVVAKILAGHKLTPQDLGEWSRPPEFFLAPTVKVRGLWCVATYSLYVPCSILNTALSPRFSGIPAADC